VENALVIDTDGNVAGHIPFLKSRNVGIVGRYYSSDASKRLTKSEAQRVCAAGLKLFVVFEDDHGDPPLDSDAGTSDAQIALQQAEDLGQPAGTAIYFALEHLPSGYKAEHVPGIINYVQQVRAVIFPKYRVGVYSDGVVLDALLKEGLIEVAWLSASISFEGSQEFYASGRWVLAQKTPLDKRWDGLKIDIDEAKPDFGQFVVPAAAGALDAQAGDFAARLNNVLVADVLKPQPAIASPGPQRFNTYILKAVDEIAATRANLGYDINSYFTRNLDYGGTGTIPANHPPKTMCVAAVCEVIVEALNLWQKDHTDSSGQPAKTPFLQLPVKSWTGGSRSDIRAHIFQYTGLNCRGTAQALARFGIGAETGFDQLQPGDFVNFNRTRSGHSVVFLGYIDRNYNDVAYSPDVAGFKYFSAQGEALSAPDHGFGYRWGFFGNPAPPAPPGKISDSGIQKSTSIAMLDCGFMFDPASWNVTNAIAQLKADFVTEIASKHNLGPDGPLASDYARSGLGDEITHALSDALFKQELQEPDWTRFDDSQG
jgi:hypothetical protein